jgi:hypothetical protein
MLPRPIDDPHPLPPSILAVEIPDSSFGVYNDVSGVSPLPPQPRLSTFSPSRSGPLLHRSTSFRHSPVVSPTLAGLREKDDPYFLTLSDSSRSCILSASSPELNLLPHPPPRVHRRPPRDVPSNGNGRLMEQLHSSRRHSTLPLAQLNLQSSERPLSRRTSIRAPFRRRRRSPSSSDSSKDSDSDSEIFDDNRTVSTRPSSLSSTASLSDIVLRASSSTGHLKLWPRSNSSPLDLLKKKDTVVLPTRDIIESEDCRFLETEFQR